MILGRAVAAFGADHPIDRLTGHNLRAWLVELRTTLAPVSVAGYVRTLKVFGDGYEIHHGRTEPGALVEPWLPDGLGWRQGNVVGVYAHGLMDNGAYRQRFLEQLGWHGRAEDWGVAIEAAIDEVAALVKESGWASHLERSMAP
jgi:adenosylcobyric acid synthase